VHALLLRAMAERSVQAFSREIRLPHLLVFADRNRVEREETFEISAAARDRFMMEITIDAPADDAQRAALAFDPLFHDADALVESLSPAIVAHAELNALGALIQRRVNASDALQQYALSLWRATAEPARFGVRLSDVDTEALMLAGASPRGMSLMMRAARVAAWLDARDHMTPEDLQAVFSATMAHRLVFQPVYEMRRHDIAPQLIAALLASVAAP
jgi:MoxR-like ATPase